MSGIPGLRGTGDFGTGERPENYRELILFRNPAGDTPIFALMAKAKKKVTDDPHFHWWDEPNTNVRLQAAGSVAAGGTTIVVDSADPTSVTADAQRGAATNLKEGDLLLVEKAESSTYDNEIIEVVSVLSDTTFTVKRGQAGSTAATIPDDAYLLLIGSSYAEGTAAPTSVSRNPIKYDNYTQIFKDTYELTGTADQTNYRTGEAWSNDKKRKTFDHSRGIEKAILFGRKHETTGDNGKPKRYMGGLREFIPASRTTVFGSAVTQTTLLDALYPVFDYNTGGGDTRVAFCGNQALNELNKMAQADANSEVNYGGIFKTFGMNFREFVMPQGRLLLKTHPLLNQAGDRYSKSAFVVDFDALRYVPMKGRDTRAKDDVQSKDEDVRRGFYQTECSLRVDYGGLTCAYLGNISAT